MRPIFTKMSSWALLMVISLAIICTNSDPACYSISKSRFSRSSTSVCELGTIIQCVKCEMSCKDVKDMNYEVRQDMESVDQCVFSSFPSFCYDYTNTIAIEAKVSNYSCKNTGSESLPILSYKKFSQANSKTLLDALILPGHSGCNGELCKRFENEDGFRNASYLCTFSNPCTVNARGNGVVGEGSYIVAPQLSPDVSERNISSLFPIVNSFVVFIPEGYVISSVTGFNSNAGFESFREENAKLPEGGDSLALAVHFNVEEVPGTTASIGASLYVNKATDTIPLYGIDSSSGIGVLFSKDASNAINPALSNNTLRISNLPGEQKGISANMAVVTLSITNTSVGPKIEFPFSVMVGGAPASFYAFQSGGQSFLQWLKKPSIIIIAVSSIIAVCCCCYLLPCIPLSMVTSLGAIPCVLCSFCTMLCAVLTGAFIWYIGFKSSQLVSIIAIVLGLITLFLCILTCISASACGPWSIVASLGTCAILGILIITLAPLRELLTDVSVSAATLLSVSALLGF